MSARNLVLNENAEKKKNGEKKTLTDRTSGQSQDKDHLSVESKTSRRSRASRTSRQAKEGDQEDNKLRIETA